MWGFEAGDMVVMNIDGCKFAGKIRKFDHKKNLVHVHFDYDNFVSRVAPELLKPRYAQQGVFKTMWHLDDIRELKANLHLPDRKLAKMLNRSLKSVQMIKHKLGLKKIVK